ncbi:hypothetical protein TBLA_0B06660 [Henningerozyma blattae CBS 6284]|uniref:Uncharacterized protein n=1 Tax=Henningerozyma blattae (strain ATCC 34711 / CBS 6284 / DSM 70876 / NBRC 10599 / NRRL Y-10934 / UCD 77-7) TaxID=1071380 RepID=I2GZD6_HENB6|nr:hypothetical protein TBLA_0B06660 [Tetrapisispora blattae CBS 6284]CCH59488.1 hypothetical protein TBLA_0B06660 [Tetrapisispora blattae CBS 6284]
MKFSTVSTSLLLASSAIAAPAKRNHHAHVKQHQDSGDLDKRAVVTVTQYVDGNGNVIVPAEMPSSVNNNLFTLSTASTSAMKTVTALDGNLVVAPASALVSTASIASANANAKAAVSPAKPSSSSEASTSVVKATATVEVKAEESSSSSSGSGSTSVNGDLSDFQNPSQKFKDGTIKCSDFPSGQGVVSLDWVGMGGWASVMNMAGQTSTTCQDGYYCSYACQAGMSKTQWPTEQPADGRSVGGLYCKDGYLYRSNTDTDYLCEWGQDSSYAVNNAGKSISLCRTDYPGSENMVVPTVVEAGSKKPMSVVIEDNYYQWEGKYTSAQYYVNNAGVDYSQGCIWGTDGSGVGNWAPVVLGSGYVNGVAYLSIIPNPNNNSPPNFNVKIEATSGSTINGDCKYENGKFTGSTTDGCTVSVTSGSANFVFY